MKMKNNDAAPVIRENIEWCRIWVPDSATADLSIPRVLLIGDSIVMGYGEMVEKALAGKASVARIGTSRFPADPAYLDEISLVLRYTKFDAIHFHNGMHGLGYDESQYAEHVKRVVHQLRALTPQATWMLANSTPKRDPEDLNQYAERNERVIVRNRAMAALAAELGLPMTDLYQAMAGFPEYYSPDGSHFNEKGQAVQAELVGSIIRRHVLDA